MSDKMEKYENKHPEQLEERPTVSPRVDVFENSEEVLLVADLPGVSSQDLGINLDGEELTIAGRVKLGDESRALGREFQPMDFRRRFVVPAGTDASAVTAELRDGVLRLHLPKAPELKPRQIEVRAG